MATTQSGFPVVFDYGSPDLYTPVIPGTDGVKPLGGVRVGAVGIVLVEFLRRFHIEVQPLRQVWGVWGFTPKQITGGSGWSNHAGGCAVDADSALFPQHAYRMSSGQRTAVGRIINDINALTGGPLVIDSGAFWSPGSVDEMHAQIHGDVDRAALDRAAARIGTGHAPPPGGGGGTPVPVKPGKVSPFPDAGRPYIGVDGVESGALVAKIQRRLASRGYRVGAIDGEVGPLFTAAVKAAQARAPKQLHLEVDGLVGPATWKWFKP